MPGSSQPSKKNKSIINPITPIAKTNARDLFGSDSDDDDDETPEKYDKKCAPIYSYVTRKLANGHSRQMDERKKGAFYIELKVYKCSEIESVQPVNRWRHSILTIKNKTDEDSESWKNLNTFISSTRKEFKNCPPTFLSHYY